ncbi:MAG: ArsR/SmtB family transcription factor, partial [Sarcina sp.]
MINPDISEIASIFADKSRSIMLIGLLGGARTTSELASLAKIKPQTATFHLNKMVALKFIEKIKYRKYSYYKLTNENVAKILELFMRLSGD